jgi:hypothetical protein
MQTHEDITTVKVQPLSFQFVDFEVIREEWNKYKLEDGVTLKMKFVLVSVMIEKSLEELIKEAKEKKGMKIDVGIGIQSRIILGVEAPKKLRGQTSGPYNPQDLQASIIKRDMDFDVITEKRNEYKLENGITIKVKSSPLEISKTSKYDQQGLPIYTVNQTADMRIIFPEEIEKELKQLKLSGQPNR